MVAHRKVRRTSGKSVVAIARRAVHTARRDLVESGRYRNVIAVAFGRRTRGGTVVDEHVVSVFVTRKPRSLELLDDEALPKFIRVETATSTVSVPIDVLAWGGIRGNFHSSLFLGAPAQVAPKQVPVPGRLTWYAGQCAITAEHVTGFGVVGRDVYSGDVRIGTVTHTALDTTNLDAARIDLVQDISPSDVFPGPQGAQIASARYATGSDVFVGDRPATAVLPSHGSSPVPIIVRFVHVSGGIPFPSGTDVLKPRGLILADPVSAIGDSGSSPHRQ